MCYCSTDLACVSLISVQRDCSSLWIAAQKNAQMPSMARLQYLQAGMLQNQSVETLELAQLLKATERFVSKASRLFVASSTKSAVQAEY